MGFWVVALSALFGTLTNQSAPLGARGPLYTLHASAPGDRFGAAVAGIGDVDGDGRGDLAVGAPGASGSGPFSGLVRVHSGSDGRELRRLQGDSAHDRFGTAVASAGDVDLDGIPDLVVGAPRGDPPGGSALVISGRDGALLWSWTGLAGGDRYGESVCGLGDVDGDGWPDVAVGAPYDDSAGLNAGRVEVRSGRTGVLAMQLAGKPFDLFGISVGAPGDVDGDGRADLLVGAPLDDEGAFNSGSAYLFSGRDGALLLAVRGMQVGDQLGHFVGWAGDVDADGRPDLGVGVPGSDHGGIDSGAVRAYSGASGALLLALPGWASGEMLAQVAGVGDIDADGFADLLAGAPAASEPGRESGRALLVSGRAGALLGVLRGRAANDWLGASLAALGDVDGDGRADFALGAPGHEDRASSKGYLWVCSGRSFAP